MNQIARCDWLPERARWSHLARSGLPAVSRKQNFTKSHIINPLLTKFVRSRWLDIGLVHFLRKKRTWPISSHLDRTNLVNNPYIFPNVSPHRMDCKTLGLVASQISCHFFSYGFFPAGLLSSPSNDDVVAWLSIFF